MKVKELMQKLSELDPEQRVVVRGYEDGVTDIERIFKTPIKLNKNKEWWAGPHDPVSEGEDFDEMAVYLFGYERRGE